MRRHAGSIFWWKVQDGFLAEAAGTSLQVHPLGPVEQQHVKHVRVHGFRPHLFRQRFSRRNRLLVGSYRLALVWQYLRQARSSELAARKATNAP